MLAWASPCLLNKGCGEDPHQVRILCSPQWKMEVGKVSLACLENKNPLSWARFECGFFRKKRIVVIRYENAFTNWHYKTTLTNQSLLRSNKHAFGKMIMCVLIIWWFESIPQHKKIMQEHDFMRQPFKCVNQQSLQEVSCQMKPVKTIFLHNHMVPQLNGQSIGFLNRVSRFDSQWGYKRSLSSIGRATPS